ncbi:hypothetical protein AB0C61_07260 [Streptomyces sp. NPDC048680]|uniref:hypothetical protein n=1 Tax=Streptomyces sp. NPDC048680 TaxID=3155492 RepID=UPI003430ABB6
MSFRLAAHAVCVEDGRALPARHVSADGTSNWTLPGCGVEEVASLRRSSLIDVGLELERTAPATGHVAPVPVGGLVQR